SGSGPGTSGTSWPAGCASSPATPWPSCSASRPGSPRSPSSCSSKAENSHIGLAGARAERVAGGAEVALVGDAGGVGLEELPHVADVDRVVRRGRRLPAPPPDPPLRDRQPLA